MTFPSDNQPPKPAHDEDAPPGADARRGDAAHDGVEAGFDEDNTSDEAGPGDDAEAEVSLHRRIEVKRCADRRLDVYLHSRLRRISRHQIQKVINAGGVTVNDKPAKRSLQLHEGDVIDIVLPPPPSRYLQPEPIPLDVLYEDEGFIVINKQANLIVHPARSHLSGTLINGLAYHFQQNPEHVTDAGATYDDPEAELELETGSPVHLRPPSERQLRIKKRRQGSGVWGLSTVGADEARPGIVHRLDKNTTGVIVVAKRDEAHWKIARQFADRSTLKAYLALVHGEFDPTDVGGVIDEPLGKHPTIREAYAVRRDSYGKPSVTLYRVRERYKGYTLLELELKTGRTHQIRVHLQYLGYPIVGDIVYGGEPIGAADLDNPPIAAGARRYLNFARTKAEGDKMEAEAPLRANLIIATPCLHAALLRFRHPMTGEMITFTAPMHEPMRSLIQELRKRPASGVVAQTGYHVDLSRAVPSKEP